MDSILLEATGWGGNCTAEPAPSSFANNVGRLFYIVSAEENTFQSVHDVPYYFSEMFPLFIGLIIAEYVALAMKGECPRLAESLNSLSHGIIAEIFKILMMGAEISLYVYVHNRFRLIDLPWDNPFTWYAALLAVDCAYYWAHRASHGCNLYALDKNYGGFLIIWDRLFGTFQELLPEQELVFGVVFQPESHNPIWQMTYRFPALWTWAKMQKSLGDSFRAILYGPSWIPGAPRLGRDEDKVNVTPRPKFTVILPKWLQAYILIHFVAVLVCFQRFALRKGNFDEFTVAMTVSYLLITLTSIGLLSEGNPYGSLFEFARCAIFLCLSSGEDYFLQGVLRLYFLPSVILWVIYLLHQLMTSYRAELKKESFALGTKLTAQYVAPTSKIYNGKSNFCLVENTAVLKAS